MMASSNSVDHKPQFEALASKPLRWDLRRLEHLAWAQVQHSPLSSMWDLHGIPVGQVAKATWVSLNADNIFGRASQLAYAFFSAVFPALIAVSSILGLVAQSSTDSYFGLLAKFGKLLPPMAFSLLVDTFRQTTRASSSGKLVLGVSVALFSASVGVSALQDTLNTVYKLKETRPLWKARLQAIGLTIVVSFVVLSAVLILSLGDFGATHAAQFLKGGYVVAMIVRVAAWSCACLTMVISFQVLYTFCPDSQHRTWRWFTPGGVVALAGWIVGSMGLRVYLHFFNSYSVTYGSLGAVVILLLWFYLTGAMILLGGEVNSEIEHAVAEKRLRSGAIPMPPAAALNAISKSTA